MFAALGRLNWWLGKEEEATKNPRQTKRLHRVSDACFVICPQRSLIKGHLRFMPWPPSRTTLVPLHWAVLQGVQRDFHSEGKLHAT